MLVEGIVSFLTFARTGPRKTGLPPQPLPPTFAHPGAGPVNSIESWLPRPKVGVPHVRMSSLVCIGPLSASASANWISSHHAVRPLR